MSTVSFNKLTDAHTTTGATGGASGTIYPGFAPLTSTLPSVKKVDPNRTIISFGPDGEIDDRLTLGDIMQNAYYLAEKSYLDAKQYTDNSFANVGFNTSVPNQNMQTNIQNINSNVALINKAMTSDNHATGSGKGTILKGTAKLTDFTGNSSTFMRKEHPYKIQPMSSGSSSNQAQAGTYLLTSLGRDIDVWGQKAKDLGFVRSGGASGRPFQFLEMVGNPDGTTAAEKGDWA
jgi:hypothetical protein